MDVRRDMLERAQQAARRLGRSDADERPGPVAAAARALYRRWEAGEGSPAAGTPLPAPAYVDADPDASPDDQAELRGLREELAEELARLATPRPERPPDR